MPAAGILNNKNEQSRKYTVQRFDINVLPQPENRRAGADPKIQPGVQDTNRLARRGKQEKEAEITSANRSQG